MDVSASFRCNRYVTATCGIGVSRSSGSKETQEADAGIEHRTFLPDQSPDAENLALSADVSSRSTRTGAWVAEVWPRITRARWRRMGASHAG